MTNVTLDDILTVINLFAQKNGIGLDMSKEYYNALLEQANLDYLDYRYSKWEDSRDESDDLKFLKDVNEGVVVTGGLWTIPSGGAVDFYRLSSVVVPSGSDYYPCDIVTDMELAARLTDSLTEPTATNPVCTVDASNIRFYPSSISSADITYIRYPATPVYGLTASNGINTYSAATEFEWPDSCAPDLVRLLLGYLDIVVDKRAVLEQIKKIEGDK